MKEDAAGLQEHVQSSKDAFAAAEHSRACMYRTVCAAMEAPGRELFILQLQAKAQSGDAMSKLFLRLMDRIGEGLTLEDLVRDGLPDDDA